MAEPLLDDEAFPEPSILARHADVSFAVQAYFDGFIVFTNWPRQLVAEALPTGWRPGHNVSRWPELHPIVFVFGVQKWNAFLFAGLALPRETRFAETLVVIPFVRHVDGRYLHAFVAHAYCADALATWGGNVHWGYAKESADMEWHGDTFCVAAQKGPLLLHATVASAGAWSGDRPDGLPGLAAVTRAFALPILGRRADGSLVGSYFDWDLASASVRPAVAVVSIDAPLGPGLEPRVCGGVESRTFEVRGMRWRVSWPGPCRP